MSAFDLMVTLWGVLIAGFTAVMIYKGYLAQHETEELFLSEHAANFRGPEREKIVRRASRIQPYWKGLGGAAAALTVVIAGVLVINALPYVRF